ncbi:MAG: class I SAM-dependent methyltransferase [Actinomycetaceae bacterium]|nr:class I SAM-dependent methyltransferase [Actinomycetaceae bacterium]
MEATSNLLLAWHYPEEKSPESELASIVRHLGKENGIRGLSKASCNFLTWVIASHGTAEAVEIGTGSGVSALTMLQANPHLHLTSIDSNPIMVERTRALFKHANIKSARYRLIAEESTTFLPRLASDKYDLVLIDGAPEAIVHDVEESLRILRPGGIMIIARALLGGIVADPARREDNVVLMRQLIDHLLERNDLVTSLLPTGDGMLLTYKK